VEDRQQFGWDKRHKSGSTNDVFMWIDYECVY